MNRNFNGIFTNNPSEISNNIITGRSAGTALDFSFSIVKYLFGEKKLEEIKKDIIY
jgi:4-methyl-5(b-hydroxyethyl)-thiazole monophosphate biosynthesis